MQDLVKYYLLPVAGFAILIFGIGLLPSNAKVLAGYLVFFVLSMGISFFMLDWTDGFIGKYKWLLFIIISIITTYFTMKFGAGSPSFMDERYL